MSQRAAKLRLIISMTIFGTIGIFARLVPLPTGVISNVRGVVGTLFLLAVVAIQKEKLNFSAIRANLKVLLPCGAMMGFNWMLLFEAYRYTTVAVATVCYYLAPVVVLLISPLLLKEKLTVRRCFFVALALLGMVLTSGVVQSGGDGWDARGVVLALGSATMYASILLLTKFLKGLSSYETTIVELAVSAVVLLPYNLLTVDASQLTCDLTGLLVLAVLGIVHTGVAFWLYFAAIPQIPAQTAAILSYIDPVVAIFLSALLLREPMDALCALGAALVLGSTLCSELVENHYKKLAEKDR